MFQDTKKKKKLYGFKKIMLLHRLSQKFMCNFGKPTFTHTHMQR